MERVLCLILLLVHVVSLNAAGVPGLRERDSPMKRQDDTTPVFANTITLEYDAVPVATKRDTSPIHYGKLAKRVNWRVINNCPQDAVGNPGTDIPPEYTRFDGSWCNSDWSPQTYAIQCGPQGSTYSRSYENDCAINEFCVRKTFGPSLSNLLAYCVSGEAFMDLGMAVTGQNVRRIRVDFPPQVTSTQAELQLIGQTENNTIYHATDVSMMARDANDVALGEAIACADCGELTYYNLPSGATNLDVNITFVNPNDIARVGAYSW